MASKTLKRLAAATFAGLAVVEEATADYLAVRCSRLADVDAALALAERFEAQYGWVVAVRF